MTRKIAYSLTAILLSLLMLVPFGAFAAASGPTISVGSAMGNAGDTITVNIDISENPGICAMILGLEYSQTSLELKNVELNSDAGGTIAFKDKIVWTHMGGDSKFDGAIFTLTFKIKSNAVIGDTDINITFEDGDICNYDEKSVNFEVRSGQISVLTGRESTAGDPVSSTETEGNGTGGKSGGTKIIVVSVIVIAVVGAAACLAYALRKNGSSRSDGGSDKKC